MTELAKQFYLSESALRSRFKEEIGVPINEYVNKRKIEEYKDDDLVGNSGRRDSKALEFL